MHVEKSRYTESQIDKILKKVESEPNVNGIYREYGFSDSTYYNWESKYGCNYFQGSPKQGSPLRQ